MPFFGVPIRNGLPIGLGSVAGFGVQQFDPSQLFAGGTVAGAWYDPSDLSTLFTTSAGTTPATMPGLGSAVSVGLMLDKSQNGVGTNGAKRVNLLTYSEDFSNAAWLVFGGASKISANAIRLTSADTASNVYQQFTAAETNASSYVFSVEVKRNAATNQTFQLFQNIRGVTPFGRSGDLVATDEWQRFTLTHTSAGGSNASVFGIIGNIAGTQADLLVRNADLRLASEANTLPLYQPITSSWYATLPGNHAIAFNDTTARPELRARVNLLTYSEEFDNGVWTKQANTTITPNQAIAPDGTLTADLAVGNGTDGLFNSSGIAVPSNSNNVKAIYLRSVTGTATVLLKDAQQGVGATTCNLTTTWQRFSLTETQSGGLARLWVDQIPAAGIYIWGADLRPANIGANVPVYQRIADANTYDTSGFPLYLRFDGVDDSMYTPANLNLSGTDKVAVFAGVRKLSAAFGTICETSAGGASGSFALFSNYIADDFAQDIRGNGGALRRYVTYAAPITNVYSNAITSAFADSVAAQSCRINGIANAGSALASEVSTGNFASRVLNIGSRNNSSLWLNGHLHSLIIAGSAVSAGNISATEQWVAGKTGIQI